MLRDVRTLFDSGTTVGVSDGELLGRFADSAGRDRSEAAGPAFAALVERHGAMVWRVCRSVLRDEHDAEDAFQATFLVLVKRAGSVRRRESVASWLYGVALRVAARARADMARRRRHERRAGESKPAADRPGDGRISPELAAIVHEELSRLPERYRAVVVLCHLEGQTCEAAARWLGWPVGTVKSRLARGRERLRGRLVRRGLGPDEASGSSVVPVGILRAALARTTVEAMFRFAGGRPIGGVASSTALSWAHRTLRTMEMIRLAMISTLLIACLAAARAAIWTARDEKPAQVRSAAPVKKAAEESQATKPPATEREVKRFGLRVIDANGRGVPDVEVKLIEEDAIPGDDGPGSRTAAYRTGADGRVRVAVDPRFQQLDFEARPDDCTFGWASLASGNAWLKANDDSPIMLTLLPLNHHVEGTIVDSRGKPIGGVLVRAVQLHHEANGFVTDHRRVDENNGPTGG
jgi:RNA polymerase sigma-70 factor (ECF subfamily)